MGDRKALEVERRAEIHFPGGGVELVVIGVARAIEADVDIEPVAL